MRVFVAAERLGAAGGMERYLDIVLPALVARGHLVHAVARRIDSVPSGVSAETIAWADEHAPPDPVARAATERAFAAFAPDLAIAHNVMDAGIVAVVGNAARSAYHVHDHRPFCPNGDRVFPRGGSNCTAPLGNACRLHSLTHGCAYGPRPRTLGLVRERERLRDAIAAVDTVIVASAYVRERAVSSGVAPGRIVTLPPPLPDAAYAESSRPAATRAVLFAGRIVPQKGLDVLIRAVGRIPAERRPPVRVFGTGSTLEEMRRLAAGLAVELDAPGAVDAIGLRDAMDAAAVIALPSCWAEPFGYVGIEAMARGRPVVASSIGGVVDWLEDEQTGVAVPPGDAVALARALDRLTGDSALRARLGTNARASAERFRLAPGLDDLLQAYGGG
jgi:glycosyltransferase involved in cell wall biosynthesis